MTNEKTSFTIDKGIEIQHEQLRKWQSIMKPEVFKKLADHCHILNVTLKTGNAKNCFGDTLPLNGYSVFRGTVMDSWISNNLMK